MGPRFDASRRMAPQTSLARAVALRGRGAHTGRDVRMILSPAGAGAGVVFALPGAGGGRLVEARWSRVDATQLRTRIESGGAAVDTVEHLMAALSGLGVDNALVELDGPEVPAMDGSALSFVVAVEDAGVVPLSAPRRVLKVLEPVRVADGAAWAELRPASAGLHLDVEIAFPGRLVGRQRLALEVTRETFRRELAPARSFGFLRDAERLWREGLALGASLDNTVALDGDRVLNPQGLRFADEFVRHKALDVVGDLALAGAPIIGAFRSYRGGHGLNLALVEKLMTTRGACAWIGGTANVRAERTPAARPPR